MTTPDLEQGLTDRPRALPIPRSSALAARARAEGAVLALVDPLAVSGHRRGRPEAKR